SIYCFFFSSRRRHTRCYRDWSSDVCSSDLSLGGAMGGIIEAGGVLQRQNDAVRAQPFQGGVLMALQDLLRFYGLIFKKPISGFRSEERRVGKSVDLDGGSSVRIKK